MILWHLGTAAALTYVSLGRRRIDYRFVLAGAVLPDAIDPVLRATVFDSTADRLAAHSLLTVVAVAIAVIVSLTGERRRRVFGIAVGWLLHLVADGMWRAPTTFLWPAFGFDFAATPGEPYSLDLFLHPLDHLGSWAGEVVGLALLAWFWVAFSLGQKDRFRIWLADGYLRP